jgi:hypothetical protein
VAFVPDGSLLRAKESINVSLPRFVDLLRRETGDRYHVNSSTRKRELFYFFSPKYPLDTYSLYVRPKGPEKCFLVLGYMPMKLRGGVDLARSIEVKGVSFSDSAGFTLMMLAKQLLKKVHNPAMQFHRTQMMPAVPV